MTRIRTHTSNSSNTERGTSELRSANCESSRPKLVCYVFFLSRTQGSELVFANKSHNKCKS